MILHRMALVFLTLTLPSASLAQGTDQSLAQCQAGQAGQCDAYARLLTAQQGVSGNQARAASFYQLGCDGGYGASCTTLGGWYQGGLYLNPDLSRGAQLFRRGCEQGPDDE